MSFCKKGLTQERYIQMITAYWWLRGQLDEAIESFFKTDNYDKLEEVCQGVALERVKRQLAEYQDKKIVWHMPDRRNKTKPKVAILSEDEYTFVCEEKFLDFSVLQLLDDQGKVIGEGRNKGQPSASHSQIQYNDDGDYRFTDFFIKLLEG